MNIANGSNTKPVLRRRVLYVITLSIPVLFFVLLEGGLRLAGYGQTYPLFIPADEAPGYLSANRDVVKRFVVDESRTPDVKIPLIPFPEQKAPDTVRIVVQGGSTAAGWPYGFGASLAGMLQQRLQATFPERNIEVITTAMAAVNSYALLDFADEIIAQQPDAVLIYAGHNEFLGIMGVGSTVSVGHARPVVLAYLALQELRTLQLLQRGYQMVSRKALLDETKSRKSRGTLMRRIVAESHIPLDSSLYRRGMAQFRGNLATLLDRYRVAGIPVFIGTLVSNEKDLEPFISELASGMDEAAWQRNYKAGMQAFRNGDLETARTALEEAVSLDDTAAQGYFTLGRVLERLENYPAARQAYQAAKDRDQLRFRAPEVFNDIIRELAAASGAHVVEVQAAFLGHATHGIIGNDLMLEHLHPNLEGYFLLADGFYAALRESGAIDPWMHIVPRDQAWNEIPVTVVDRLKGEYEILRLKADWPFTKGATSGPDIPPRAEREEQLAYDLYRSRSTWPEAMRKLLVHYAREHDTSRAAGVTVLLADTHVYDEALQYEAGMLALKAGRYRDAVRLFRRALRHTPEKEEYLVALERARKFFAGAGGE